MKLYIIVYLIDRFFTEFLRPEPVIFAGLTGYQWAIVAMVPVFVVLWAEDAKRAKSNDGVASGSHGS